MFLRVPPAASGARDGWDDGFGSVVVDAAADGGRSDGVDSYADDNDGVHDSPCTEAAPCLFDIDVDPLEEHNLASTRQDVVAKLKSELAEIEAEQDPVSLDRAETGQEEYCEHVKRVGWVLPFE